MDLSGVKPSKHFGDRVSNPRLRDKFHSFMYSLLFPIFEDKFRAAGQVSPQENAEYQRKYGGPVDLNDSWTNYNKEEQKLIRDNGWSPADIQILRKHKKNRR